MNHPEAQRLIGAYLDRQLGIETTQEMARHLVHCPVCADLLHEWGHLSDHLKNWPLPQRDPPAEVAFSAAVLDRLPQYPAGGRVLARRQPWHRFLFPLGAVLSAAFVQAGAIVSLLLGISIMLGVVPHLSLGLNPVLPDAQPSLGSPAGITWPTWVGDHIVALAGPSDAIWVMVLEMALSWVVPSLFFVSILFMIMMLLSGWFGWQMRGRQS